jgi:hypothetical protein
MSRAELPELAARIAEAIGDATTAPLDDDHALRYAVCEYTGALRDAGYPPEQALAAVKTAVHDLVNQARVDDGAQAALERVVQWCIHEYYGTADPGAVSPRRPSP